MSPRRLRRGELIAGASGALLLVFLFALEWYAVNGPLRPTLANLRGPTSYDGWQGLGALRWLALVTALAALALTYWQAAARAPAIPVTIAVIVTALGALTVAGLIYRVLINPPGGELQQRPGAYLGLLAAAGIAYGGYRSLREEAGSDPATLGIETVTLQEDS